MTAHSHWRSIAFATALAVTWPAAGAGEKIIIDQGYDDQTRIAVVPFGTPDDEGAGIAPVVSFDLARSGQFDPLPPENMLSLPTRPDEVFFRDWRVLGVEYVLVGQMWELGEGELVTAYHLLDVFNERELLS